MIDWELHPILTVLTVAVLALVNAAAIGFLLAASYAVAKKLTALFRWIVGLK